MGTLKWYKRDPRAALTGMMGLTLEERGAYNTVLDLIYAHDGQVEDNPKLLSHWLGVDPRAWKRLRARLLGAGKIYIHAGNIRNERADKAVPEGLARVEAATLSATQRWASSRKNNGLDDATAMLTTTTSTKSKKEGNFKTLGEGSGRGKSPPKHGQIAKDKGLVYYEVGTFEWPSAAADYKEVHGVEPTPNQYGGRWYKIVGEATPIIYRGK